MGCFASRNRGDRTPVLSPLKEEDYHGEVIKDVSEENVAGSSKDADICKVMTDVSSMQKLESDTNRDAEGESRQASEQGNSAGGSEKNGGGSESHGSGSENKGVGSESHGSGSENKGGGSESHGSGSETKGLGSESNGSGSEIKGGGDEKNISSSANDGGASEQKGNISEPVGGNSGGDSERQSDGLDQDSGSQGLWSVYMQLSCETLELFEPFRSLLERCFLEDRDEIRLGYDRVIANEQIVSCFRKDEDTEMPIFKNTFHFAGVSAKTVYEVNEVIANRLKWDKGSSLTVVKRSHEDDFLLHTVIPGAMMIDSRDFVERTVRYVNEEDGIYVVFKKSVDDEEVVKPSKKCVRAITHFQASVIYRTDDSDCIMHMISCADFGGKLPKKMIVQQTKNQSGKWLKQVMKAIKNYKAGKL